jgi:hypothetical protein
MGAIIGLFGFVFFVALYIGLCFCLKKICLRCGKDPGVLIWIPIVQLLPMIEMVGLPPVYIIAFFIPLVNFAAIVYLYWKICEKLGKPGFYSLAMLVPLLNIGLIVYLAFGE